MTCEMTKGQDMDKFLVIGCDGEINDVAGTLVEAESKADRSGACGVLKLLRVCKDGAYDTILKALGQGKGEVAETEEIAKTVAKLGLKDELKDMPEVE